MSVFVKCDRILSPEDYKKLWAKLQEHSPEHLVLLPAGCDLASPKVLYECDRRACERCNPDVCHLTHSIEHAVNFEKDASGTFIEKR